MADILVIDDELQIRRLMARALEGAGHAVAAAENGRVGLDHFMARPFDLVITDIIMPDVEGVEVVRAIRTMSDVPLLVITGGGRMKQMDFLDIAAHFGASDTLAKPFRMNALVAMAERLLAPTALMADALATKRRSRVT
jgi:DNA-binding NtrC family response regulator